MQFEGVPDSGDDDDILIYRVTEIADDKVVLDSNHPLAAWRWCVYLHGDCRSSGQCRGNEHGHIHDGECDHDDWIKSG